MTRLPPSLMKVSLASRSSTVIQSLEAASTPRMKDSLSRNCSKARCLAVASAAMPNHSVTRPSPSLTGTAREKIQPVLPSARRTRCSISKGSVRATAVAILSLTSVRSSGSRYSSIQRTLGASASAMKPRPCKVRISCQSGLIEYRLSELASTSAANRFSLARNRSMAASRSPAARRPGPCSRMSR